VTLAPLPPIEPLLSYTLYPPSRAGPRVIPLASCSADAAPPPNVLSDDSAVSDAAKFAFYVAASAGFATAFDSPITALTLCAYAPLLDNNFV